MRNRRGFLLPFFLIQINMQKTYEKYQKLHSRVHSSKKKTGKRTPSLCAPVTAVICGLCRWYFLYNYSRNLKKETPTTTIYPKARLLPCCGFTVDSERASPFPHLNNSTKTVPSSSPLAPLQKEGGGSRLRSRNRKLSLVRSGGGKVSSKT